MAQYARPASTTVEQNMSKVGDSTIHACIDDVTPDDETTYIQHPNNTSDVGSWRVTLSSVDTPDSGTRTLRIRWRYAPSSGTKTADIGLYEGGSGLGSGTLVQQWLAQTPTGTAYADLDLTVTGSVSDYSDLQLQIIDGAEDTNRLKITQVYLEVPDAPSGPTAGGNPTLDGPPTEASVFLAWTDSPDNTGVYVHRNTVQGFTPDAGTRLSGLLGADVVVYEDTSVGAGTQYYYVIEWVDAVGSTYSSEVAGHSCWAKPTDLTFSYVTGTQLWVTVARGYNNTTHAIHLYEGSTFLRTGLLANGTVAIKFEGLTPSTTYTFKAQSYDQDLNSGLGAWSTTYDESQATTVDQVELIGTGWDISIGTLTVDVVNAAAEPVTVILTNAPPLQIHTGTITAQTEQDAPPLPPVDALLTPPGGEWRVAVGTITTSGANVFGVWTKVGPGRRLGWNRLTGYPDTTPDGGVDFIPVIDNPGQWRISDTLRDSIIIRTREDISNDPDTEGRP